MVYKRPRYFNTDSTGNAMSEQSAKASCPDEVNRRAKIIVRNLPFKGLSDEGVKKLFAEFGEVQSVNLLKRDNGRYVGCGFVQFKDVRSAARAIHAVNGKDVKGRPVIVDWALPKDTFIQKVQKINEELSVKQEIKEEGEEEDDEVLDFVIDKTPTKQKSKKIESDSESENEEEDDVDDDDEEEDEAEDVDEKGILEKKERVKSNDVDEGRTVFIKNIPFSVTKEELNECCSSYGGIVYAVICMDPVTEHSRGTGFVKFQEKESADKCIKDSSKFFLHEHPLEVTLAVSKEQLQNKRKPKNTGVNDARNLYLLREGVIMAGSSAANGVSSADMTKRLSIEHWKSQILRNLNMFVSRTRLVVHNLPASYNDTKLRELFVKHSSPQAVITEARVLRNKKSVDAEGMGKSKEFGFVSFSTHEDAISVLRKLNNNPEIFGNHRRPIVGFSVENKAILNLKQKRVERSRAKLMGAGDSKSKGLEKLNRKQRRAVKRKEKFIQKREELKKAKRAEGPKEETKTSKKPLKRKSSGVDKIPAKKPKKLKKKTVPSSLTTPSESEFLGVVSEPGKRVNPRSSKKLISQATTHMERIKKEKKQKQKQKVKEKKPDKQKQKKPNLNDDVKFTKLISQYKKKIETSSNFKKWYE